MSASLIGEDDAALGQFREQLRCGLTQRYSAPRAMGAFGDLSRLFAGILLTGVAGCLLMRKSTPSTPYAFDIVKELVVGAEAVLAVKSIDGMAKLRPPRRPGG